MNAFEYAMVLISIIAGLGITHILANLGTAVHRLRHHGPAIRLEINYLSWIAFVFCWLVNFWWWEFKWSELAADFGFDLFVFLVLYATSLFLLSARGVPWAALGQGCAGGAVGSERKPLGDSLSSSEADV